jgi:hypothetical protein
LYSCSFAADKVQRQDAYPCGKEIASGTSKGTKKTRDGRKVAISDKVEASETRDLAQNITPTPIQTKGIRKNIGGHKSASRHLEPANGHDRTNSPGVTIPHSPASDRGKVVQASSPVIEESRDLGGEADPDDVDAYANAKRRLLRNLETGTAPKPKKRKF